MWPEAWGTDLASSCDAASRKVRRLLSGKPAILLLLGVLTGAGGILQLVLNWLSKRLAPCQRWALVETNYGYYMF